MIELNLTYEESKKILDLGYDFRRVSNIFVNEQGRFYNRANNYLAVARDITLYEIDQRPDLIPAFFRFIDHLTPIIPKAALEACLPNYLMKKGGEKKTWISSYHVYKCRESFWWENTQGETLTDDVYFLIKAFIWCHEHYPKELKDKFNELRLNFM
jgi:hypothetical protein